MFEILRYMSELYMVRCMGEWWHVQSFILERNNMVSSTIEDEWTRYLLRIGEGFVFVISGSGERMLMGECAGKGGCIRNNIGYTV